jgi:hypothetical protein
VILREYLVRQQDGPHVVPLGDRILGVRAVPAVRSLVGDDVADVAADTVFDRPVVEKPRERDCPVQPVGRSLPALRGAAEPLALPDVRPELVQVTGEAVSLDAQLPQQPARGANRTQRQGSEGWLRETRSGGGRLRLLSMRCRTRGREWRRPARHARCDARQELPAMDGAHGAQHKAEVDALSTLPVPRSQDRQESVKRALDRLPRGAVGFAKISATG